ncbi:hypothetical protein WM46_18245 [Citrobacter freundii complex sp. CFNIH2]|uniref:hypothetical protein n=1 Tax=Citrobacter freundii complex sp. CFNIH2 TaxID=2066049 RepID=UPI000C86BAF8|nr:hypothetical protein [Citrobacter freundii complex sp. CFNIH2]AUO66527.1 hypothetical protein WM46_18245 [Citrobacter freundii complex sp. CFNIH2]
MMLQQRAKNNSVGDDVMVRIIRFALLCSILINVVLLYRVFDLGVMTTYGMDEIHYRNRQASDLKKLLPLLLKSTSQEQILLAAKQADLEVIKKSGEGTYVGTVLFTYSDSKVIAVDLQ